MKTSNDRHWYRINIYDMEIEPVKYVLSETKNFVLLNAANGNKHIAKKSANHEFKFDTYEDVARYCLGMIDDEMQKLTNKMIQLRGHYSRIGATL